jgi:hypothetical protein
MFEESEGNESAVAAEESASESQAGSESQSAVETQEASTQQEAAPKQQDVPFHEHPRFKEVIEQKNQAAQRAEMLEKSYQQLQAQVAHLQKQYQSQNQAQKPSYDPLFKQLEQVNPEFASFIKENYSKAQQVDILQQELASIKEFQTSYQEQQALNQFDKLCQDNKVDTNFKDFYRDAVANAANASGAPLSALPEIFKQVHERLGKTLTAYERSVTEKYVANKSADAKKPAATTGGTPAKPKPSQAPISQDEVKKQFAEAIRARKNAV